MKKKSKIRLYCHHDLSIGSVFALEADQSHYLCHVMKISLNDEILVFDGVNGEFIASIAQISTKSVSVKIFEKTRPVLKTPYTWLLFAPLKKDQTDFVIQKATELGATCIVPVITQFSITEKAKTQRFLAQAIEACEQCRRLDVPEIKEPVSLNRLVSAWNKDFHLFFMDETLQADCVYEVFNHAQSSGIRKAAFLIGPEGGFSDEELSLLRNSDFATGVCLGKRILRAETAAVAALACWQAIAGDWRI